MRRRQSGPTTGGSSVPSQGKAVLTQADFTYLGIVKVPLTDSNGVTTRWDYAHGGIACRYVGPDLHLFISGRAVVGDTYPAICELIYDKTPNTTMSSAQRLSWYHNWGQCYGSDGLSVIDSNGSIQFGLNWDGEKLLWGFGPYYSSETSRSIGAVTFNGTSSSTPYGPWRPTCNPKQTNGPMFNIPSRHQAAFGGKNMFSAGVNSSIQATNTWGNGMEAYNSLNLLSTAADSISITSQRSITTQSIMTATLADKMQRASTWQKCDRGDPNQGYSCIAGPTTIYSPTGLWCETDSVGGVVWIDNTTKHGIVYLSNLVDAVNASIHPTFAATNYNGDTIPHEWYSIADVNCCHGHTSLGTGTGPHAPSIVPQLWIYDPATILSAAAGTITPLAAANTYATRHKHLNDYSQNFPIVMGAPYQLNCTYDHVSRLLFMTFGFAELANLGDPFPTLPVVHVFEVAN